MKYIQNKSIVPKFIGLLLLTSTICCNRNFSSTDTPRIIAGTPPVHYFIQALLGTDIVIPILLPTNANPVIYEPRPQQLKQISHARLYVMTGMPFELAWKDRFLSTNPELQILELQNLHSRTLLHSHSPTTQIHDPHIWLSPKLMLEIIEPLTIKLSFIYPEYEQKIFANKKKLIQKIQILDQRIRSIPGLARKNFVVYHPSWAYFARDYNLQMFAIEQEGQEPDQHQLIKISKLIHSDKIKYIIVQPEFNQRSARMLATQTNVQLLLLSPLASNWDQNLFCMALAITGKLCLQ